MVLTYKNKMLSHFPYRTQPWDIVLKSFWNQEPSVYFTYFSFKINLDPLSQWVTPDLDQQ